MSLIVRLGSTIWAPSCGAYLELCGRGLQHRRLIGGQADRARGGARARGIAHGKNNAPRREAGRETGVLIGDAFEQRLVVGRRVVSGELEHASVRVVRNRHVRVDLGDG